LLQSARWRNPCAVRRGNLRHEQRVKRKLGGKAGDEAWDIL